MPTYALDESFFEENDVPLNETDFTRAPNGMLVSGFYGETKAFSTDDWDKDTKALLAQLQAIGITRVTGRYDGSSDEGFAYFARAFRGDEEIPFVKLVAQLIDHIAEAAEVSSQNADENYVIFMGSYYSRDMFKRQSPEQRVKAAFDYLAYVLASELLGSGFGTGVEGVMYGAFQANLETGEIIDEYAEAPKGTFDEVE